jgi:FlaG/FlaF family flagellin (archaellin)
MSLVNCRRAVSAVFSVLLMIIIIFVAGIFLYNFVSGMMGDLTESSSSNQLFSLRVENVAINSTCMTIHIGNAFNYDVGVTKVYINNEARDLLFSTPDGVIIPKDSAGPVYVMGSYTPGGMYDIKIIFNSGNSLMTVERY